MKSFKLIVLFLFFLINCLAFGQSASIQGKINSNGKPEPYINLFIIGNGIEIETSSNEKGDFIFDMLSAGEYQLMIEEFGFKKFTQNFSLSENQNLYVEIKLESEEDLTNLGEVVISGTMKAVSRLESPVPVEVYSPTFFKKNPTPNIFEAMQGINGVRPQVNCNVCDTGDIHINGLEGPYTMVLIDGMPIVSSLGSVYGLSGIPNSLVERVEVVKGPASSLYGSEAVGGLINIITKNPKSSSKFGMDVMATSYEEYNVDVGFKLNAGKNATSLTGINYYNYQNRVDKNNDGFTDVTLQHRISVFQKWNFDRRENRVFSLAGRYMYEDRWGGDMRFNRAFRGGDEIYGESVFTNRSELIGMYQLPLKEKMFFNFSAINHNQDSRYGDESYIANQKIAFGQLTWDKTYGKHDLLSGIALRYTYYDDNTPATATLQGENEAQKTWLPGIFIQDEIALSDKHKVLLGMRYDHNNVHGSIFTPRLAYKWTMADHTIFRLNAGTGFRVVNLFTEEHAALTGARDVVILNDLKPEKSYNINLNFVKTFFFDSGTFLSLESSLFYTYFNNQIVPDYDTDPNKIFYDNLDGHAESKGISLNVDLNLSNGLKFIVGGTLMANPIKDDGFKEQQILTEHFMGTWAISYKIRPVGMSIDYTGNVYSPMRLPLLGELDPRPEYSPWWSIQNIQFTYEKLRKFEFYSGVKNLLNWTPAKVKNTPFIISRTHDPFDKEVLFDANGQAIATAENPYALTFDPEYVYAPNQGIRFFIGMRFTM